MAKSDTNLCECGCGNPTPLASRTDANKRWKKGHPKPYIPGHGAPERHGMSNTPTYKSWKNMIRRCTKPNYINEQAYKDVSVCQRWREFKNFYSDMGERPDGTSLDRINNNLGYEPANCRWATKTEQDNNKKNNVLVTFSGETLTISQWSRITGINSRTLHNRYKRAGDRGAKLFRPIWGRES